MPTQPTISSLPSDRTFVGRQQELRELRAALDEAISGKGRLIMLVGEPSIGKTRTSLELAFYAESKNFCVLWGRCYESAGAPPYWPWIQVIRAYMRERDPETLRSEMGVGIGDIAAIVPEVRELFPDLPPPAILEELEQARFRLFNSVSTFLNAASRNQPLLLVLDNLHGADKPSLLLLEFLAQEVGQGRILALGTYRDVGVSRQHPLFETLRQLAREPRFRRMALRGLTPKDVSYFIASIAGVTPPQSLVTTVYTQTEGNPLFVSEVSRLLVQEGILRPTLPASSFINPRGLTIQIPEGIREAIGERLNRLSEGCVQMLTIASAIGREFGLNELEGLVDYMTEDRLLETLDEAVAARIIEEMPQPVSRYQFTHALIRETLYDELSGPRRSRLHRRIGEAMEALYAPDLEPYLARLSHHFFEAARTGSPAKAIEYSSRAAERDMALLAYEEAARYYQTAIQALALQSPADEASRCKLLLALGEAHAKAGDYPHAMEAFAQAAEVAKKLGASEDLVRAALGFEDATWRPGLSGQPAAQLLSEALNTLEEGDSILKARVLASLARALNFSGSIEQSLDMKRKAVDMGRRLGDPYALIAILRTGLADLLTPGNIEERLAAEKEILELADRIEDRDETQVATDIWTAFDLMSIGDMQGVKHRLNAIQRQAEKIRSSFYLYIVESYIVESSKTSLALAEGRFDEAEQLIKEAYTVGQRVRGTDVSGVLGVYMFTLRREQGRLGEVAPAVRMFLQQHSEASVWRPGLALIYCELGMEKEARADFERLVSEDAVNIPLDAVWLVCMSYMAEVCAFLGDSGRARPLYRLLLPYSSYNIATGGGVAFFGAASRYLGMLASTMGKWDEAEQHFEEAIAMDTRTGSKTWLAHSCHEYAKMLLARSQPRDLDRAKSLLGQAAAISRESGMNALQERVVELQKDADTRAGERLAAHPYPDDLTEREVEVMQLIAQGKSNREIANSLFITPNTVATHVKNILSKTGSANRAEAAAYVMRHNLT